MTVKQTKSVGRAYACWLLGGIFGLHHFYLRRDRQAFICWSTFGGYVFGWLGDLFRIPEMVRDANNDPEYVENFKKDVRQRRRPPFAFGKLCGSVMVAYLWGQVSIIAIPETSFNDINWSFLHGLVPIVVALGVWTSGNCGRQQGNIWPCLIAAYAAYPLRFIPELEKFWLYAVVIVSSLAFDKWSKQWRLTTPTKRSLVRRIGTLYVCGLMYLSLFGSYCYFNAKITNADGDVVHVHEAISSAMNSPWWSEFKQSLGETYAHLQHRGYYETYKMIIDQLDTDGEQKALEVLGLKATATQGEITATFRRLSKEHHPDKVKGSAEERRAAQERFMQISQAYEKLSQMKSKRRQRNRKSTTDSITL